MSQKIVIASVLKPVDDVRAYMKIAQSLAQANKYDINIIGNEGKKDRTDDKIRFDAHSVTRSQWLKRLWIRELILFKCLKIKPQLIIITTHELIKTALLLKLILRCKVVYDVQENYAKNTAISSSLKPVIFGSLIRLKEWIGALFIDHFLLAERCYENELSFIKHQFTIVENKAKEISINRPKADQLRLLFSGTISDYSGAKIAMQIMQQFMARNPNIEGRIVGQIHDQHLRKFLKNEAWKSESLQLHISEKPLPYEEIIEGIQWANLGIIAYQPNDINRDKIPTKLYEYSRYKLPYLIQRNSKWATIGSQLGGAIPVVLEDLNTKEVLKIWANQAALFPPSYPDHAKWETEVTPLIEAIKKLN